MEHLKTTVIALNEKVEVLNDVRKDLASSQASLADSQGKREELHIHIKTVETKIASDSSNNKKYQDDLIADNEKHCVCIRNRPQS